ncbi:MULTISPECIES: flavodoxin family protein [Enterococcus]|uniref:Flavodoxin family protein n=1 Tax=Candidatus Enterococcus murrayae TaxID=2815321 RepID=A0ABS3HJR8_9ENTE|nr:flavodoxin family protein [Enterococcus sp. MJM16]MBO0453700.1 flavodoxin family protein [Enterococcus sp. MJM16]
MKLAVIYYSKTGQTKEMAEIIAQGMRNVGSEVRVYSVDDSINANYVNECSGIVFGTPTYMATSHWRITQWLMKESGNFSLAGKLGGGFATAHYAQGGSDSAILSMLGMLLVKGMLIYSGGATFGQPFIHHGPVALDAVGNHYEDSKEMFELFGQRFAEKAFELFGK